MEFLYVDDSLAVCIKPPRVLSTDEPGGLPELVRQALGTEDVRTVHRLDRVVSGVMVVARGAKAAQELSRQIRQGEFFKEYLAVVHGCPEAPEGRLCDLLVRDKARRMTMVAQQMGKGVQEASLRYRVLGSERGMSLVAIQLETGRTHQIRVQFASRGMPLAGERKYAVLEDPWEIALWSCQIGFAHPVTGERLTFSQRPPRTEPWTAFGSMIP